MIKSMRYYKNEVSVKELKNIPKIDKLIREIEFKDCEKELLSKIAKKQINTLRKNILNDQSLHVNIDEIKKNIKSSYENITTPSLKPLINASGVVIHTNLGRAPLHASVIEAIKPILCGYSNLEYNEEKGTRGQRYNHSKKQLCALFGVEDALIVNNNAAAVFLVLNTFAKNKKTILSRGELVEIGGSFRIPEVMKNSGTKLVEVGTTNKTNIKDYELAISKKTAILMKVHRSNFYIKGFCEEASLYQISDLAKKYDLIDYYDVGGAYARGLDMQNKELDIYEILKQNPSLLSFSADKLLGSVQGGIILGKAKLIEKLRKNQLLRMLRVDKLTLSIIEQTLLAYLKKDYEKIPILSLINQTNEDIKNKITLTCKDIKSENFSIISCVSYVGGGTLSEKLLPSYALKIHKNAQKMSEFFRQNNIIGRIENDSFLLDFRCVLQQDIPYIKKILKQIA